MPFSEYQRQVVAYHGCDHDVVATCLRGAALKPSTNDYDWLGTGIYFWEHGPARALDWARFMSKRKKVRKPAVVGALIQLGHCFDLLDVRFTTLLHRLFPVFQETMAAQGKGMPANDSSRKLHRLDCAFLNWAIPLTEKKEGIKFQTVRGVFVEGEPLYPSAQLFTESHIQIAVRDPSSIVGFFHPVTVDSR